MRTRRSSRPVRRLIPPTVLAVVAAASVLPAVGCGSSSDDDASAAASGASGGVATTTVAGVSIASDPALTTDLPSSVKKAGVVNVGSDPTIPPWEMRKNGGEIIGMDPDIGHAIGAKLGVEFKFDPQRFDGLVPAIQAGKFAVALSNMADTKERQRTVDFVDYAGTGASFMVPSGNPGGISTQESACGKKIALTAGSTYEKYVKTTVNGLCSKAGKPAATALVFPDDASTQLAVKSGKADATLTDGPSAAYIAQTVDGGKAFTVIEDPSAPAGYNPVPIGVAVAKDQTQLRDAIKRALDALIADGTLRRIMGKYGLEAYGVRAATINAGH